MTRRNILLSVVLVLVVLFTIKAFSVLADGCCFLDYVDYSLACYEGDESECTEDEGEFFDGYDCELDFVKKCLGGCCCGVSPDDPYPIRKGTCQTITDGLFLGFIDNLADCNAFCGQEPLCGRSCENNTEDCFGANSEITIPPAPNPFYYCWENNVPYTTFSACDVGCPIIGQCELGEGIVGECYCEGISRSSGSCCEDGSYVSSGGCASVNDCETYQYQGSGSFFECCNSCMGDLGDPSQHWVEDTFCSGEENLCCLECASGFEPPDVEGECDEMNPPPVDDPYFYRYTFKATHVKGRKQVNLTWENPCPIPEKVLGYYIRREPSRDFPGTKFTPDTSFIDSDVEWSSYGIEGYTHIINTYTYYIRAEYLSGRNSSDSYTSVTMGHSGCEGVFGEGEFCLQDILTGELDKGYGCDENNDLELLRECDPGYVCFGPDVNGFTRCKEETDCGQNGNPFGLFNTETSCLAGDAYCYYDYSDTIVDDCKDCGHIDSCYNYSSRGACETDSCLITGAYTIGTDNLCEWYDTFEEFGKGICYDRDYDGVEYCNLCSKNSTIFNNIDCDQSVCSKLGACFSVDMSCEPCSSGATCEDFEDETACVNTNSLGSTPIGIDNCQITRSDDACSLGVCKWGIPLGESYTRCFKDADDDDVADCSEGETKCRDFEPFDTEEQPDIPKMNSEGYDISFYLREGGSGTPLAFYFCIDNDEDNPCCPDTTNPDNTVTIQEPLGQDPYVVINPLEKTDIITETGYYFIRYYSVDSNNNVEEIKSTQFLVDPTEPEMTLTYDFYSEGDSHYSVIMATSVDIEYVNCNYDLGTLPTEKIKDTNFNSGLNLTFFIVFEDLDEGYYTFTAICTDTVGNLVSEPKSFNVRDMSKPLLEFFPELPEVVYASFFHVTGFTDPSLDIHVALYDEGSRFGSYPGYTSTGVSEPKAGFNNIPVGLDLFGQPPSERTTEIFFKGDYTTDILKDNYVEFSNHIKVPRYKVKDTRLLYEDTVFEKTQITIEPPLENDIGIAAATATAYTSDLPDGWFDVLVELQKGLNHIGVIATRDIDTYTELPPEPITYETIGPGGCIRIGDILYCTSGDCTDSDGGLSYYVKGTCTDSEGSFEDNCDGEGIWEFACSDDNTCMSDSAIYTCSNGCQEGACIT